MQKNLCSLTQRSSETVFFAEPPWVVCRGGSVWGSHFHRSPRLLWEGEGKETLLFLVQAGGGTQWAGGFSLHEGAVASYETSGPIRFLFWGAAVQRRFGESLRRTWAATVCYFDEKRSDFKAVFGWRTFCSVGKCISSVLPDVVVFEVAVVVIVVGGVGAVTSSVTVTYVPIEIFVEICAAVKLV